MSPKPQDSETSQERAVVDRIVDGLHAVLLIGEEENEQVIPVDQLPDHITEGTWLLISQDDEGRVTAIEVDDDSTTEAEKRIASKLDKLRRRGRRLPGA